MPDLYILAGPNGSGKTTFYSISSDAGFIDPYLPFINVDLLTQGFGDYTTENILKAENLYRQKVQLHIDSNEDFMIESNLAEDKDYTWIGSMKKRGYETILYYLNTDDVVSSPYFRTTLN